MKSNQPNSRSHNRRNFLRVSAAAAAGSVALPYLTLSANAFTLNADTLKVGLVGCGGRGTGAAAQALAADSNVVLTAMGDIFDDRLQSSLRTLQKEESAGRVQVDPEHQFLGFDAYQKVIASGVDVVLLTTPPGFRPEHLEAAVAAGKHVFCEKPMAVDAPGVRKVLAAAEMAKQQKTSLVSGFCWRYHYPKRETFGRVLDGAVGAPKAVYTTYNTGPIWVHPRKPGWTDVEYQMRNWYYFTWLSGDHIAEQAVHSLDMMSWALGDVPPLQATAHGGRQVRIEEQYGHIFDHFGVVYDYPDDVRGFHFCRQQANTSHAYSVDVHGAEGHCLVDCRRNQHIISGKTDWSERSRNVPNMYQVEHNELFASIRQGEPMNDGAWMAQSTMLAILGRMAAYTGQTITWDEAMHSEEELSPRDLDWNMELPEPPVARPGETKFV